MTTNVRPARRRGGPRPVLSVRHEDDGGLTIQDHHSGIVVSIIGSHPLASGPRSLVLEAYAFEMGRRVMAGPIGANDHPFSLEHKVLVLTSEPEPEVHRVRVPEASEQPVRCPVCGGRNPGDMSHRGH